MPFVKVTPEMVAQALTEVDWAAQAALTDEDIARQVEENPDAARILSDAGAWRGRVLLVRRRSGLSEEELATRFHVPLQVLRAWESDCHEPDAMDSAYLRMIEREPEAMLRALAPAPKHVAA